MEKGLVPRSMQPPADNSISSFIDTARGLGFVAVGFSRPQRPQFFDQYCAWIAAGKQGRMSWLGRHLDLRENPASLLEGCRTVITLAYPYPSKKPSTPDGFSAARYAEPKKADYHLRLRQMAKRLIGGILDLHPGSKARVCVDSAPIIERSFAYTSGIGFIGKNNMLIIPEFGSYVFLMEVLTTAFLSYPGAEQMENQCGTCTRCVDACPSGALKSPFLLDASKCLSYLTIEDRGAVDRETGGLMRNCFFGCDICQEVCPFNEGRSTSDLSLPSTDEILAMGEKDFIERFGKTSLARAGLEKLKSNIRAVRSSSLQNSQPKRSP
jgi:epoxyqueuosine reductase